jgi:hypothetical protein
MARKRLGEILLERRMINMDQLNRALVHHRQFGIRLGSSLVAMGLLNEDAITRVLSESLRIPMADLSRLKPDPNALAVLDVTTCEKYHVFPVRIRGKDKAKTLILAMADPLNIAAIDEIGFATNMRVDPVIAQESSVDTAIQAHYRGVNVEIAPLGEAARGEEEGMTLLNALGEVSAHLDDTKGAVLELAEEVTPWNEPSEASKAINNGTTGVFYTAGLVPEAVGESAPAEVSGEGLAITSVAVDEDFELLEKRFWALMRVLVGKGLVTREEFLHEMSKSG